MLSKLDNMDKHNTIVPVAAGQAQVNVQVGARGTFIDQEGNISIGGGPQGSVPFGFQYGWGIPDDAKVIELLHDNCEVYRRSAKKAILAYNT